MPVTFPFEDGLALHARVVHGLRQRILVLDTALGDTVCCGAGASALVGAA